MYFQTLDIKSQCIGVYVDGSIYHDNLPDDLTRTWSYSTFLKESPVEYARLYCEGRTLNDVCPDLYRDEWEPVCNRLTAFYRALREAKVDLNENCFYDLVPENFLKDFCEIKNKITKYVFENYSKPPNYEFLVDVEKIIGEIRVRSLTLNFAKIKSRLFQFKTKNWHQKLKAVAPYVDYNLFGTKTGRLTTKKNSFPILTMPKEYRNTIEPANDWFLEMDFNSAELRTLLALSGKEQPDTDIHQWNAQHAYGGLVTREGAKQRIFAWLYNPESADHISERAYDRDIVLEKYWDGEQVHTMYDRIIPSDKHHALNYIIQSTTSDLFLRRMVEVNKLLEDKKSHIAFCVHDSLVIDLADEDKHLVPQIKEVFGNTDLGAFRVNLSAGKNYGDLKELKI